jgi:hypothetical protein
MHPMTYKILKAIPRLEFEQFRHLDDRGRLNEIRTLAKEQVADDSSVDQREVYWRQGKTQKSRQTQEYDRNEDSLWPEYSERQRAIIAGMEPILDMVITAEQRVLLRQVYDEQADLRTIGRRYGVSHVAILGRLQTIHKHLREALLKVYGPQEEKS